MTASHEKEKHKGFRNPECVLLDIIKNLSDTITNTYTHTHTHTPFPFPFIVKQLLIYFVLSLW